MAEDKIKVNNNEDKLNGDIEKQETKELLKNVIEDSAGKKVVRAEIVEEMQKAYIDYAMSVIVSRAIPSVEDGLKPVQRRILYAMNGIGLYHNKQTKKSARIVGEVLGKYHPHGDLAVYDALVRMAQDFSLRYPLVKGQGNFGSLDGDQPAAQRYTEAKMETISSELLEDIDKDTVNLIDNYDASLKEPTILPGKIPNLLLNGATGIAVGMATNIPPHNLTEVCDAIIAYIKKPKIDVSGLMEFIKGPDFPTGGYVSGDIKSMYEFGKGSMTMRAKTTTEVVKKTGREKIIVTEIPYMVNKSELIKEIAKLATLKKLPDVSDIRDESSKGKVRIVIELKKNAKAQFTLNRLFQYTRLQTRFSANIIALVKGQPKILGLKEIIKQYVLHRKDVIIKRSKYDLRKAKDRLEIVLGLIKALSNIDSVVKLIRSAPNSSEAHNLLIKKFSLSSKQAKAILEMRLSSLTSLERDKLSKESKDLKDKIKDLEKILGSEKEVLSIIVRELKELKKKYGDSRRTYVLQRVKEIAEKDLVEKKDVVVTFTDKGYCKRIDLKTYKEQRRGGKGVIGSDLSTGDFVKQLMTCSTHDYLLFFTTKGRVYWLKAHKVPAAERYSKGKAIINLLNLKNENIASVINVRNFDKGDLVLSTSKGHIKKMPLSTFSKPRSSGVRAMNFPVTVEDSLINVKRINDGEEIILITKKGQAIRFKSKDVRSMGRAAYGVTGIKLNKDDVVVSLEIIPIKSDRQSNSILTITENGYGKRSNIDDYRLTGRAGKGVINLKVSERTKGVVTSCRVRDDDKVIITTAKGMVIKTSVNELRIMGRATQGVRIVKLQSGDKVTDLVRVIENIEDIEEE